MKKKAVLMGDPAALERVYGLGRRAQLEALTELHLIVITARDFAELAETPESEWQRFPWLTALRQAQVVFSTWGMPPLTACWLDLAPRLQAVFYAAGSVQGFARPLLERGITVVSAWQANAVPVAEFALAQILLANKGYWRNLRDCSSPEAREAGAFRGAGNFGETVALLGAGAVGRLLIELLRPFRLRVVVFDPFLDEDEAARLGVEKVSLETAFESGLAVSNHLANNAQTVKLLSGALFARMRRDAVFINTGRGATVDEAGLLQVLRARPDLTALLDVTWPEPPPPDSPWYGLPNAHLTSHIAGSLGDEVVRLADLCLEEFRAWQSGEPLRWSVDISQLERMA